MLERCPPIALIEERDGDGNHREHAWREERERSTCSSEPQERSVHVVLIPGVTVKVVVFAGRQRLSLHACERTLSSTGGTSSCLLGSSTENLKICSPEYVS